MNEQKIEPSSGVYPTTQWTQIIGVIQRGDDEAARRALNEFCERYRPAIFSFFRQRGCDVQQAEDYTHDFFEKRILNEWDERSSPLHKAQRIQGGKFRSFLAAYLWRFIQDKWKGTQSQRAGGGFTHVPMDALGLSDVAGEADAFQKFGRQFDRVFALVIILKAAEQSTHSTHLLAHLRGDVSQKEAAGKLGMSEAAFKTAFARFRHRFKRQLREEVVKLVGDGEQDIQDEIRYLMSLFVE